MYIISMCIVAMVLQRTHTRTLSNYRLNRCKPLRFNERVVTWKLCVVASSTPMFTIGVVAVVHFPWKRYRNYVPGFRKVSRCSSEETTLA